MRHERFGITINPLPTNDAPMRHDLCELSIMGIYMEVLILGAILQYMVSASFKVGATCARRRLL